MKRLISVKLSVIFVFVILSQFVLNVSAATIGSTEYDFYFYYDGIGLSNYKGDGGFVSIPATYNGFNLYRIDTQAFFYKSNVTGVEIPNTVISLGNRVFEKCMYLKSVTISDSVTSFGSFMFFNCYSLEDVVIGNGMTYIPAATFANCNALRNLTIPESVTAIADNEFIECPNLTIHCYKGSYAESYAIKNGIPYNTIPSVPASLKAVSVSYNSIKICWGSVYTATGYIIYRYNSSSGKYDKLETTSVTSYTNSSLSTGKIYKYKLKAYATLSGKTYYSNYSTIVSCKPVPAMPSSFTATKASSTSIKLCWGAVAGANSYEVFRYSSSTGKYGLIKAITSTTYTNTGLTKNKIYNYKVRAYKTVNGVKVYGSFTLVKSAKPY